ncbi:MAG: hypothetical protein ABJB86_14590, partial [Bacteroidota bacterium]
DSLGKLILKQLQQLKSTATSTGKSVAAGALQVPGQILRQRISRLMQTGDIKGLINQFTGIFKQPVLQWKGGSMNITGQTAPSLYNDGNTFINSMALSGSLTVAGVPLGMRFMRQDFNGPLYYSRSTFSFEFDREAYLNSLRDKIKLKINTSDLLPDYNDALQKLKDNAIAKLRLSLDSINSVYKGSLNKQLEALGGAENILKADASVLQEKLLSAEFLQNIEQKKNLLAQMQQQLNAGGKVDMNLYDSVLQSIQAMPGTNKILNTIHSFKEEAQKSGLIEKLRQAEALKKNNVKQWLRDPDKLKSLAKEQLDLNGMQKMFLNINQLTVGMNTINLSPLTVYQYTNNGFNASFVNNKTYLFIMSGRQQDLTTLFDSRYSTPLFSIANTSRGIRIGKGDLTESHTHISLFTYKQNKSGYNDNIINTMPGSTMVATFSNRVKIDKEHSLDIEISKSAHKYDRQQNIYDTLQQGGSVPKQLLGGGNFIQQMAFTLQWKGQLKENELDYDLHATRIGNNYSNPGSVFISAGTTEFGGSLRKFFLKNQLQMSAKGNYRGYEYGGNNAKWRNYSLSFQGKWKLKKGQYISLRYQPYQSLRIQDNIKYNAGGSSRLSADGNIRKRFGKINYQHTISLSALKNSWQFDNMPIENKSFLISSVQAITVNRKSYFVNIQYNISNQPSSLVLLNTQFNADAGYMYTICKKIMGSTAINYNSTKGWFQQTGIKQTFSGQIGERFIVSLYADIIKNIREYRANNMGASRLDWSLQYLLK